MKKRRVHHAMEYSEKEEKIGTAQLEWLILVPLLAEETIVLLYYKAIRPET